MIFVGFSLIPTLLLFFVARGFINDSFDYWFHLDVEQAVEGALGVSQDYYTTMASRARVIAQRVAERMEPLQEGKSLDDALEDMRREYALSMVELFDDEGKYVTRAWDGTSPQNFTEGQSSLVENALVGRVIDSVSSADSGEFMRASAPFPLVSGTGVVVVSIHLSENTRQKAEELTSAYRGYTEMKLQKRPIETNYVVYLMVITFLILFSAVWLGFYLARGITVPIGLLAEGAEKVASGDLTVRIDTAATDEIGILVEAFNRMTEELETTSRHLDKAYRENEERRAYIETVLKNVGTGVVSMDPEGRINTFNRAAEKMFSVPAEDILGRVYTKVLSPEHTSLLSDILEKVQDGTMKNYRAEIPVMVGGTPLILLVNAGIMQDADNRFIGSVFVLEDMTKLVDAQKKAAWSEAAKRIAHEIKNPLTPIRLSAERIRKRLGGLLSGRDEQILVEGTDSIIREVEGMRGLVDEFSQFARLPVLKPVPGDINQTVNDAVYLYTDREGMRESLVVKLEDDLPGVTYDGEQVRRVIINLLDNALRAVGDINGKREIIIETTFLEDEGMVAILVSDNGPGIIDEYKDRIFEPYFSTKKDGTGLGLAIAQRIMEEHGGIIVFSGRLPQGSNFTVKIPVDIEPAVIA